MALAEMALAGHRGAEVHVMDVPAPRQAAPAMDWVLFSESNGRYLVEVAPEDAVAFEALLETCPTVGSA